MAGLPEEQASTTRANRTQSTAEEMDYLRLCVAVRSLSALLLIVSVDLTLHLLSPVTTNEHTQYDFK